MTTLNQVSISIVLTIANVYVCLLLISLSSPLMCVCLLSVHFVKNPQNLHNFIIDHILDLSCYGTFSPSLIVSFFINSRNVSFYSNSLPIFVYPLFGDF